MVSDVNDPLRVTNLHILGLMILNFSLLLGQVSTAKAESLIIRDSDTNTQREISNLEDTIDALETEIQQLRRVRDQQARDIQTLQVEIQNLRNQLGSPYAANDGKPVICTADNVGRFYITRSSDGFRFGEGTTLDLCRAAIQDASPNFVCSPDPFGRFYPTRISNGERLGEGVPFNLCLQLDSR